MTKKKEWYHRRAKDVSNRSWLRLKEMWISHSPVGREVGALERVDDMRVFEANLVDRFVLLLDDTIQAVVMHELQKHVGTDIPGFGLLNASRDIGFVLTVL